MGLRAKFGGGGKCLPWGQGFAALRVSHPRGPGSGISHAARAFSLPACRGGPCKQFEALGLTAFGFLRTSPYRSKLLTALHEKSPALCAELQIVCGEGGIRTPGASQLNSFQDCRNRPLYHLSIPNWDCKFRKLFQICKIFL